MGEQFREEFAAMQAEVRTACRSLLRRRKLLQISGPLVFSYPVVLLTAAFFGAFYGLSAFLGWAFFVSAIGAILIVPAFEKMVARIDRKMSVCWKPFWSERALLTSAKEKVEFLTCEPDSKVITVRFPDGEVRTLPLSMLFDENGSSYDPTGDTGIIQSGLTVRMSKVRWKTLDGRIGKVREAYRGYESDTRLTLKLDDGAVEKFEIRDLEPVPY